MKLVDQRIFNRQGQFSVGTMEYLSDSGQRKAYDVVIRPPAVTMVPVVDGQVLMVRQFRVGAADYLLELPAGKMDAGEDLTQAVCRELREETGYMPGRIQYLTHCFMSPGYSTEIMFFYYCSLLHLDPLEGDEDDLYLERVNLEELDKFLSSGQVRDAKSLLGLSLAKKVLNR